MEQTSLQFENVICERSTMLFWPHYANSALQFGNDLDFVAPVLWGSAFNNTWYLDIEPFQYKDAILVSV